MAVKDWRRTERRTALAGLLTGTLRYGWVRTGGNVEPAADAAWEGLIDGQVGRARGLARKACDPHKPAIIRGHGIYQIEQNVAITETGYEILSHTSRELRTI
jgi:hypothetical protein